MLEKSIFTIGEFAQNSGVSVRTLRYYDSIGLLIPSDYSEGGHRLYTKDDLATLRKIKALQFLGFSLKDIKEMLAKNTIESGILLTSLNYQKELFEAKRLEIINILSDLNHMMDVVKSEKVVNIEVFCSMLQKLMFEEDTEKWLKEHFSTDLVETMLNVTKSEEIRLDKKWAKILSTIKQLSLNEASPSSTESQEAVHMLFQIMDETMKGNLHIVEELHVSTELAFPNPFTEKEQKFIKEAMAIFDRQ